MAGWPSKKNAAFNVHFSIYDNDGDLVSGAAALDSEVSIDHGTFTDCTNEATEIATSSGVYYLALVQAEMNGDIVTTITKTSTTNAKTAVNVMYTSTRQIDDLLPTATYAAPLDAAGVRTALGLASANVDTQLSSIKTDTGTTIPGRLPAALVSGRMDSSVGAMAADVVTAAAIANAAIDIATFAADVKTGSFLNAQIKGQDNLDFGALQKTSLNAATPASVTGAVGSVTGAVGSVTGAVGSVTGAVGSVTGNVGGNVTGSVGSIATGGIAAASFAAGAIDAAAIASNAIAAAKIATDAVNLIADGILSRDVSNAEGTAALHSLLTAVLKAVSKVTDNAGTLETYRTNGTTLHMSQALTTDAANEPIDSVGVGS